MTAENEIYPTTTSIKKTLSIIFYTMIAVLIIFSGYLIYNQFPVNVEYLTKYENTSIVSLSDTSLVYGSFVLGTGSVSDEMYFTYYEGTTSFRLKKIPADQTIIIMDENTHPYLTKIIKMERTTHFNNNIDEDFVPWQLPQYEFHVPNGTIVKQYNLNGV